MLGDLRLTCWEKGKGDKAIRNRKKEERSSWSSRWLVVVVEGKLGHRVGFSGDAHLISAAGNR
jgi:hypothetical protein